MIVGRALSSPPTTFFVLSLSFYFPPSLPFLSPLVSSLSLTAASDLGHSTSVSDSLFGPGSPLSLSNVMSRH